MDTNVAKKRKCIKEKDFDVFKGQTKRIHVPIEREEYEKIVADEKAFRKRLDELYAKHPELFPQAMVKGYRQHDILPESKKLQGVRLRRIKLRETAQVFTIFPFFLMPYMTAYSEEVEKALYLRRYGVPYSALSYVFGKNDMFWYRLEKHVGRNSIVGTTVKKVESLPEHLVADEKFTRENKNRVYIPMTTSDDCILGVSVIDNTEDLSLRAAYQIFQKESLNVCQQYSPLTATTDGYGGTRWSWQTLFPRLQWILCFFHSFLRIREKCKRPKKLFHDIAQRMWQAYHCKDEDSFHANINLFKQWADNTELSSNAEKYLSKFFGRIHFFAKAYSFPGCYRTTANVDRLMDKMHRFLYSCKYFHGHKISSEYLIRSWAILHNFMPYCSRTKTSFLSPAHKINGFVYHQNWLKNLLVSSSMGGFRQ